MDPHIIELEKKVAFQEAALAELHAAMLDQYKRIEELEGQLKYLKDKLASGDFVKNIEDEEPPPHY